MAGDPVPSYWHRNLWLNPVALTAASVSETAAGLRRSVRYRVARPQDRFRRHALVQENYRGCRASRGPSPSRPRVPWSRGVCMTTMYGPRRGLEPVSRRRPIARRPRGPLPARPTKACRRPCCCWAAGQSPASSASTPELARGLDVGAVRNRRLGARRRPLSHRRRRSSRQRGRTSPSQRATPSRSSPRTCGPLDWFCSDVVCYPAKLWSWLEPWIASGSVKAFVVTSSDSGKDIDWDTLDRFASVPGARLVHPHHNKHELTWLK